MERGDIIFIPRDRRSRAEATKIENGQFRLYLEPGTVQVQIFANQTVPGKIDRAMNQPVQESLIPPEYNVHTTLEAVVTPRDDNQMHFDLPLATMP